MQKQKNKKKKKIKKKKKKKNPTRAHPGQHAKSENWS
jgi:hypothetical protein